MLSDLYNIKDVGSPTFSVDGERIVYTLTQANAETDQYQTDIMLTDKNGKVTEVTHTADKSEFNPVWSPDGNQLAWLSDATKTEDVQIFVADANGKNAKQLTAWQGTISDLVWLADSQSFVIVGEATLAKQGPNPLPIEIDRFHYKDDERGYITTAQQLYVVDAKDGSVNHLATFEHDVHQPSPSPDGKWLAFVSKTPPDTDRHINSDIYLMNLASREIKQVSHFDGPDSDLYWESRPAWSPDSTKIAYLRSGEQKWMYYHPNQIVVTDIETGHEWYPAHIDRSFYKPRFASDGSLYALLEESRNTYLVNIDMYTGRIVQLTKGDVYGFNYSVSSQGEVVVLQSTDVQPFALYMVKPTVNLLVDHNGFLAERQLVKSEDFSFTAKDGTDIHGLIVKPHNYDAKKRYPTILRVHGGPVYQFSHEFMWDWQLYAARGYVVVAVNPRGSSGRGFDYAKAIYANWGSVDKDDLLTAMNYVVEQGLADPNRLAIGGWSYGSILTNYVIASDNRFKAAVSGAGTSNMLGTYGYDQYPIEYELELGTPWHNKDAYERVSYPYLHADRIKTPTLFQCSELDFNVPCLGAAQMYQALKSLRVDTRYVIYPEQHHGIGVPSYLTHRMQQNLDWYGKYLKVSN
ncbi:S9 family peptidase [Alteromonas sp. D210916BOD_24]|uniref:S9 family peptidase n=1 Tax=Alteromonas sp. D210916BOD_24 TaxID=3157618 RepID=UPI00399D42C7